VDDETEVCEDQFARGVEVLLVVEAFGECAFLLGAEYGERVDGLDIGVQIASWRQAVERQYVRGHFDTSGNTRIES